MGLRSCGALLVLLLGGPAVGIERAPLPRRPEARVGPYRVVVERVTHSQYLQSLFLSDPLGQAPRRSGRRSAHVQLRLLADEPQAGAAVELFTIHSLTVMAGGKQVEVSHYGGPLENNDDAVLRAYVYASDVGLATSEIRSLAGEITAFEHARVVTAEIPLSNLPVVQTVDGVRFTCTEVSVRDGIATIRLLARAPEGSQVVAASSEATYGIKLWCVDSIPAAAASSTLGTTSEGDAEYTLGFQSLHGTPSRLQAQVLMRGGERRVFPFDIEHIPLPGR
jgi:hypothetical protein